MDGRNVNLKFLRLLKNYLEEPNAPLFVELGTCGLHILHNIHHNCFTTVNWEIERNLTAIYTLFNNVPARRADYIYASKSDLFPLKFCHVRWLNNEECAERGIAVTYVEL